MKKVYFLQRLIAYIIDILIISVVGFIATNFLILNRESYDEAYKNLNDVTSSYVNGEIEADIYLKEYNDNYYTIEKSLALVTAVELVFSIGYLGTFAFYCNGMTLGKRIMKIKVDRNDDKNLSHGMFILRAALISGLFSKCLSLFVIFISDSSSTYYATTAIDMIHTFFVVISAFMILFRKDGRGVHDLIVGSKVNATS